MNSYTKSTATDTTKIQIALTQLRDVRDVDLSAIIAQLERMQTQ